MVLLDGDADEHVMGGVPVADLQVEGVEDLPEQLLVKLVKVHRQQGEIVQ
ncbi:hypothetical protein ACIBG8_21520 [Nonomuraea sp. NPDC050556]